MSIEELEKGGYLFEGWHVIRFLGEGSYGKVYEIEREEFGTSIRSALKVISIPKNRNDIKELMTEGMDEESASIYFRGFVEDFVRECQIMSNLKGNSFIVSFEDYKVVEHKDEIGWDILIRMEMLTPFVEYLGSHKLNKDDVLKLGISVCMALELCEKQNIIHRDIKPANIFVSQTGDYKLGDFGIARIISKTTGASTKVGTNDYMAPEVYRGETYGKTVDIYSLGLVLYRLLNNNRMPFLPPAPAPITHSQREEAVAKRMQGIEFPNPVNADEEVVNILKKATAFKSEDRYQTPHEMREGLEKILKGYLVGAEENESVDDIDESQQTIIDTDENIGLLQEEKTEVSSLTTEENYEEKSTETVIVPELERIPETVIETTPESTNEIEIDQKQQKSEALSSGGVQKKRRAIWISVAVATILVVALIIGGVLLNNNRSDNIDDTTTYVEDEKSDLQDEVDNSSNNSVRDKITDYLAEVNDSSKNMEEDTEDIQEIDIYVSSDDSNIDTSDASTAEIDRYDSSAFSYDGSILKYEDEYYSSRFGIDVSHYQKDIDWNKVKNAGVDFAIIRLGYRGYGTEGTLNVDSKFEENINNAQAAGLDVGIYFFSQAINEEEAREEANFVLSSIKGYKLQLPIAMELMTVVEEGRTSDLSSAQLAKNANAFCEVITSAGYDSLVAFNDSQWDEYSSDIESIRYPYWYGDYNLNAAPPFICEFLQYSNKGNVDGINTAVDLDIQFVKKK